MSSHKRIYFDNASATPIDPRVLREVSFHFKNIFGNAGSIHKEGVMAKKVLDKSRVAVARFLGALFDEIVFTSGGTESNNLAVTGLITHANNERSRSGGEKKLHAITTVIEHSSILECFKNLEKNDVEVTYLPVNPMGVVNLADLKKSLRPETILVSIQYANNEIGTVQPISAIAKIIRRHNLQNHKLKKVKTYFHTDASQAPCYLDCDVRRLGVDLLTLDGQKIYGPKGVGALYVRRDVSIEPIIFGGGQERGLRPGTENVPLVAGLAKALEICATERKKEVVRLTAISKSFHSSILKHCRIHSNIFEGDSVSIVSNGSLENRLPSNLNYSFRNIDTEFLTLQLDAAGISVSTKSACLGSATGSYVVQALGGDKWRAQNTIRISFGRFTKKVDIQKFIRILNTLLNKD